MRQEHRVRRYLAPYYPWLNIVKHLNTHGYMTIAILYYIPYLVNNKDPFILLFVPGNDIPLQSILDLPILYL